MELDPSEPEMLQGYFLPNLAFTGQLKLKVRRERACADAATSDRAANETKHALVSGRTAPPPPPTLPFAPLSARRQPPPPPPSPLQGKKPDELVAMSPLSVQVESVESEVFGPTKKVTWTVPVPSQFGLDATATLPPIEPLDAREVAELYPSPRAGAAASVEYVLEPAARVAVAPFGTEDTVGEEANQARKALFAALQRDGRGVVKSAASGRPVFKLHEVPPPLPLRTHARTHVRAHTAWPCPLKPLTHHRYYRPEHRQARMDDDGQVWHGGLHLAAKLPQATRDLRRARVEGSGGNG